MGFDVESMIGRNCLLNVTHNQVGDKTYANVASVNPLMKGMPTLSPRDYVRKVDRQPDSDSQVTPARDDDHEPPPFTADEIPF
jgi:hypothetical protein